MKRTLCILLALTLALGLALGAAAAKPEVPGARKPVRLPSVTWRGNAYIRVTMLERETVWFQCGWDKTSRLPSAPVGVNFGVYDLTDGLWGNAGYFPIDWREDYSTYDFMEINSQCPVISGHEYRIHLYLRSAYEPVVTNFAELNLYFTAP
ncbi:MAG TPA: hypothetical protein VLA21_05930 [Candidatus Limnocylindria bacterium]|nr:hypothetical protein [Candidatus Limnocylindria bacterium]